MDAGDRFIPIVEDDQGEGYKDLVEELEADIMKTMNTGDNVLEYLMPKPPKQIRSLAEIDLARRILLEGEGNS